MEKTLLYTEMNEATGLSLRYTPIQDGGATVTAVSSDGSYMDLATFGKERLDEAHILYLEAIEVIRSQANRHENPVHIRASLSKLLALFRREKVSMDEPPVHNGVAVKRIAANPGKKIEIDVDGIVYERLPVRTRLITTRDRDLLPLVREYAGPHLKPRDMLFVSEKALSITQGRIIPLSDTKPSRLARLLARHVDNDYGSAGFHGFGHGTAMAMQLLVEEAGTLRTLFAAFVAAVTRPLGIRGMFYRICGKRAKSIDCPTSFVILEYAYSAKLAPIDPKGAARRIKESLGVETIILDSNYRGAFSLGKTSKRISETFIGKLFRDNPLGQLDEMTPFCIVRPKRTEPAPDDAPDDHRISVGANPSRTSPRT